jgi:hypothetical protein
LRSAKVRNVCFPATINNMSDDDRWWEPPLAGTEITQLLGALDRLRMTFRWKTDNLDAAGLNTRLGRSTLTLGGLLKHLARAESQMWGPKLDGTPLAAPWSEHDWDSDDEWDFTSAADDPPAVLYELWDSTIARCRERITRAVQEGGLDQPVHLGWGDRHASLRRLVCDLIEEYGRHTGHADLLRENVDGLVGEDPPAGWRPGVSPGDARR